MNHFSGIGRLGRDNELKFFQDGTAYVNNSIAIRRSYKNQQGEYDTDWINFTVTGKSAENFAQYVQKGDMVGLEGRIQVRNFQDQSGNNRTSTDLRVSNFTLISQRNNNGNSQGNYGNPYGVQQGGQNWQNNQHKNQPNYQNTPMPKQRPQAPESPWGRPDHEKIEAYEKQQQLERQPNLEDQLPF